MTEKAVSFLKLGNYGGGMSIPEGDYAIVGTIKLHKGQSQDGKKQFPERLVLALECYPIDKNGKSKGEKKEAYLSFGSKANQNFAPNPKTGKGIVPIPGTDGRLQQNTNAHLFIKSLFDSGLPEGIGDNDFSVIDGSWVHIQNIPEPEERKGYRQNMAASEAAEGAQEEFKGNSLIPVVTEFLEGGKPWENGGGVPKDAPAAKPNGKAAAAPAAKAKAKPAKDEADNSGDIEAAALEAIGDVLSNNEDVSKIKLKTDAFKYLTNKYGDEVAAACQSELLANNEALGDLLASLNYQIKGLKVVVVE